MHMRYEVVAEADREGLQWHGRILFLDHTASAVSGDIFFVTKQVRIHLPFPSLPCSVGYPLFHLLLPMCSLSLLCPQESQLQSCSCPTLARLCGEPGTVGDGSSRSSRWAPLPCAVPLDVPYQLCSRHREGEPTCHHYRCHHCHYPWLSLAPCAAWLK